MYKYYTGQIFSLIYLKGAVILVRKYSKIIGLILITITLIGFNIYGNIASNSEEVVINEVVEEQPHSKTYSYKIMPEPILDLPEQSTPTEDLTPIAPEVYNISLLEYSLDYNGENIVEIQPNLQQTFSENYTDMEGIITFRGNSLRNRPSYGISNIESERLVKHWEFNTIGRSTWGGGSGWTGQPTIVRWSEEIKEIMNIEEEFKNKEGFTEVIQGSLDGNIYFLDLNSGKPSRKPIYIKNPIKGSLSIDPREYPLLYIGDGINETGRFGYRIFSLIDGEELFFIKGNDSFAYRGWGAFDGSGIINSNWLLPFKRAS